MTNYLGEDENLYAVYADYRPKKSNRCPYFVIAKHRPHAIKKFNSKITWLEIYKITKIDNREYANRLIMESKTEMKYICF